MLEVTSAGYIRSLTMERRRLFITQFKFSTILVRTIHHSEVVRLQGNIAHAEPSRHGRGFHAVSTASSTARLPA